ncbi:hypothetical protein ACKKBG_A07745 [Auxenochlorella protothecoides x Auxenochlorella symbiontica]|uniref:OTU domain-containing protein n=2 Tax=Auxenochlorella protothecoides TaxID=3075 RepID=A0A1D2A054_AUXPR
MLGAGVAPPLDTMGTQRSRKSTWTLEDPTAFDAMQYMLYKERAIATAVCSVSNPFVVPLGDAAVNVGFGLDPPCNRLVRLAALASPPPEGKDVGWREARKRLEDDTLKRHRLNRLVLEGDVTASRKLLKARLLQVGLETRLSRLPGKPDSQFEALSTALWGSKAFAGTLRALCLETMAEQPDEFQAFLGRDFEPYLARMALPTTAGDELTLRALCSRFGIHISVVTGECYQWVLHYSPPRTLSKREVYLAWSNGTWAPVRQLSALRALRMAITGSGEVPVAPGLERRPCCMAGEERGE